MNMFEETIQSAINDLQAGKMVILTDHPDRENEGDLVFPAENANADAINFMLQHGSGIVCLSLLEAHVNKLGLDFMVPAHKNKSGRKTPFTVSIEASEGITTGVSAQDRAKTIVAATQATATANDIVSPGHVFPLQADAGGVLVRAGHTEGSLDLVKLAGFKPAAVICELMNKDGSMMKGDNVIQFANDHQLKIISIDDLIHYRRLKENLIKEEISSTLPLEHYGNFDIMIIKEKFTDTEHTVLSKRSNSDNVLVRVHSSCITGEIFGSLRCDCKAQLNYSLQKISQEGGMLIYLHQEGRGIGLFNKIKSYALQAEGLDTIEANEHLNLPIDARNYYIAANILRNKNITAIRLLTNNPVKVLQLKQYGIAQVEQERMPSFCHAHNQKYLLTKKTKLHHDIDAAFLI